MTTHAAEADIHQLPELMHGEERELYGDKAYWCEGDRQAYQEARVRYRVNRRGTSKNPLSEYWKGINRSRSRVRVRCEHPFLVVKRLWGFEKVRYRGLAKNTARAYTAFAGQPVSAPQTAAATEHYLRRGSQGAWRTANVRSVSPRGNPG